ncbi:molybdate ABC transporter substrate-binding protein [Paracoccus pacificus]|uniref:Molybdate ABC transporter substrate-binding protein n=1 Tax=Paracoccus pacificus TaxID=1463598 RepID=A0ABW4R7B7_9RHOB
MFRHLLPVAAAIVCGATLMPRAAAAEEVVVFAAASMKTALDQVATDFKTATGNDVTISYAGSNTLAKQIQDGAPADVFISASVDWMDAVEKNGDVVDGARVDLLGNKLVLVAHDGDAAPVTIDGNFDLKGALDGGKLAMAMVDSVPAGQYGKQSLTKLGLWDSVQGSVAQADNVRAALALVSTGEAPYGIVYATDAAADPNVKVVGTFPDDSHDPIIYPAALLKTAADPADKAFFEALRAAPADEIFTKNGFTTLD